MRKKSVNQFLIAIEHHSFGDLVGGVSLRSRSRHSILIINQIRF